jgi:hypothetical protein
MCHSTYVFFIMVHGRRRSGRPKLHVKQGPKLHTKREVQTLAVEDNHAHHATLFTVPIVHTCRSDGLLGKQFRATARWCRRDASVYRRTNHRRRRDCGCATDSRHADRGHGVSCWRNNGSGDDVGNGRNNDSGDDVGNGRNNDSGDDVGDRRNHSPGDDFFGWRTGHGWQR